MKHNRAATRGRRLGAMAVAGVVVASSLALAGCSSGTAQSGSASGSGGGDDNTLVVWDYGTDPTQGYLDRFDAWSQKTGIKVDRVYIRYEDFLSKILQAAAANSLPDVIAIDNPWNSAMAAQGVLQDITDRVDEWGEWDQYYDGPKESATWDGKIYGVPNESNALIMYYDKTVLDEEGVAVPTTWDELRDAAKKLTTDGRYGFATSMTKSENSVFVFESLLWQAGKDLDALRTPEALSAMQYLKDLLDDGSMSSEVLSWDLQGAATELVNGRAAITFGGTWLYPWMRDNMATGHELGIAVLPAGAAGQASNLGGENWAITAASQKQDEAFDLITFMSQSDQALPYLEDAGQLPSRRDIASDPAFSVAPFPTMLDQLEVAKARVYGPNYPQMADALVTAFQSVLSGEAQPEDAMTTAADTIEPLLAK